MVVGDDLYVSGNKIGTIAGFDITHMPNHLNIVISSEERISGKEQGLELGMEIRCTKGSA